MGRNGVDKHANCHFECESNIHFTARLSQHVSIRSASMSDENYVGDI